MINLQFRDQVDFIIDKIDSGDNFSLSRYGDGELAIIEGRERAIRAREVARGARRSG